METFRLISMTDFISQNLHTGCAASQLQLLHRYKDFLKQPLTLGMFVPCDERGNILTKNKLSELVCEDDCFCKNCNDEALEVLKYQEAKEKVLFKGFEVKKNIYDESGQSLFIGWESYNSAIFLKLDSEDWKLDDFKTIEDLITSGYEIELTESAINQLGINHFWMDGF